MEQYMENSREILVKWLKVLVFVQIVSVALSLMGVVGFLGTVRTGLGFVCWIAAVYALFQLARLTERYRKAFLFRALAMAGNLVSHMFSALPMIGFVVSLCATVASYQEYHGHSEIVEPMDEKLAGKWCGLFWLEFFLGLASSVVAVIAVMTAAGLTGNEALVAGMANYIVMGINLLWQLLYLSYMKKTLALLEKE